MSKKTLIINWTAVSLVILVLLIIAMVLLTPAEKKQPQVDYLAEYNRISKPVNFDPNDNAEPYFDKAFELMADEPNEFKNLHKLWPGDMNEDQLQTAKQWVESNRQALDYLQQAISKKYYWKPLKVGNNKPIINADTNDLGKLRKATYLLCINAKLKASQGQIEPALIQLVDVYKMGTFLAGPKLLVEQLVGIAISARSIVSAFEILDHTNPSPDLLENFQNQITLLSAKRPFLISISSERLIFDDEMRRNYMVTDNSKFFKDPDLYMKKLFFGTIGYPWVSREKSRADMMYNYLSAAAYKTPWELHIEGNDVSKMTEEMTKGTLLLSIIAPALNSVLKISYRVQVHTDGLITTIAILRYKADKGRYPQDLQTLVADGYLAKLPIDPFSGSPLVYKLTGDNFVLYSFAEDLDDDGGKHDPHWARDGGDGDYVFWPVQNSEKGK